MAPACENRVSWLARSKVSPTASAGTSVHVAIDARGGAASGHGTTSGVISSGVGASSSGVAARAMTPPGMAIEYETGDLFDIDASRRFDVILSSLFAHHLGDAEVVRFLRWMEASAARGWFVNDLHRHALAYHGFRALSRLAGWHRFVQHDGPISVARAFRRREWMRLLDEAGLREVAEVRWYTPFRLCVGRLK